MYAKGTTTGLHIPNLNEQRSPMRGELSIQTASDESRFRPAAGYILLAIASYIAANNAPYGTPLILLHLISLCRLTSLGKPCHAFYGGLAVGTVSFASELTFFFEIFGPGAFLLWGVLGTWVGLFALLANQSRTIIGERLSIGTVPLIWLGLEYFRSECYYLKFSWLTVGSPFINSPFWLPASLGNYGTGALLVGLAYAISRLNMTRCLITMTSILPILFYLAHLKPSHSIQPERDHDTLSIAGIQLEFPSPPQIIQTLNTLIDQHPDLDLIVLSEYSLQSPPTDSIKQWCRTHKKHLIIGGKAPIGESHYHNTAFVVSPKGTVIFQQAKSEPIQFFDDGKPALKQKLWESPWGSIGIAICYDLSFTRVIDELIRQGAQLLIIPTMDVASWGLHEHQLHAKIAPIRAAEYQIPIVRIASSGISQSVNKHGQVQCQAPYPDQGMMMVDQVTLVPRGRLPWDRTLGPAAAILVGLGVIALALHRHSSPGIPAGPNSE